jgi:hypothetical protein
VRGGGGEPRCWRRHQSGRRGGKARRRRHRSPGRAERGSSTGKNSIGSWQYLGSTCCSIACASDCL